MKKKLYIIVISATFFVFQSCITIPEDSDQPWNMRQSWEGAPSIPGMTGN